MPLTVLDNHTIDLGRLTPNGFALDVGARGFVWADTLRARGLRVYAIDPAPDLEAPPGVAFCNSALVGIGEGGNAILAQPADPNAWHLTTTTGGIIVPTIDITDFMAAHRIDEWEAVKLNCEGAEIGILKTWPGPIAKQITASFHEHVWPAHGEEIPAVLDHLAQWYECVQHPYDERHGSGLNHWDSCFIRREG